MELKVESAVEWRLKAEELRSRAMRWAAAAGYECTSDLRDSWAFSRGTPLKQLVALDVRNYMINATVRHEPGRSSAYCSMNVNGALEVQSSQDLPRLRSELEELVAFINTGGPAPVARRAGNWVHRNLLLTLLTTTLTLIVLSVAWFSVRAGVGSARTAVAVAQPDMPVNVTYRAALMGPGLVLQLENTSQRTLAVWLSYHSPTFGWSKERAVDLPPGVIINLGWAEDLKLSSGDEITLRHADYSVKKVRVP